MNKFIKFIIGAILALLIVSLVHGEPLVARQYGDDPAATPVTTDPGKSVVTSSPTPDDPKTLLGKLPVPDATPTESVSTADTTYAAASGSPSAPPVPGYTPTGTGSLISQWASLTANGAVPTNPSSAPAPTTTPKAAETPSSAHKIETGLINVAIIAGIVSYFY